MVPPDGREHGHPWQFLGRYHIVLLHVPLVLLVLVPVLDIAARSPRRRSLGDAAGALLCLAALFCFVTAFDGWLLAWSGGYRGDDVTRHMWAGALLTGACTLAWLARRGALPRAAYPPLIAVAVGLVFWAGHTGGSLSHGEGFLTERMPARVRALLGMRPVPQAPAQGKALPAAAVKAGPASVNPANAAYYAVHVAPLFERSCVSCHRPQKHKGGLQLDTFAHLMRGGEDGAVIVPGNPKASELLRRVQLPASDDDSMPSDGDKPFSPDEIHMVDLWIAAGARSG
jgi:hypothetical protein